MRLRTPDTGQGHVSSRGVLTAREAAEVIGANERTIRRAIARGDLPAIKQQGVFGIRAESLKSWQEKRGSAGASLPPPGASAGEARRPPPLLEAFAPMIGRERELAFATSMLRREDVRLLTLTGTGGIGKTRLGLEVAAKLQADFADGVHVVLLAETPGAGLVATGIAQAIGLQDAGGADSREALFATLRDAHVLLVLDNFEHVLEEAPLVSELLRACPQVKVMVTSRALLRVRGEHALPVPPLELPDAGIDASIDQAGASPAVRLFVDRAREIVPSVTLTAANAPVVSSICHRLGGLPLAIELAASQITVLPPDALLARIDAQLPLPYGGPRDAPDRQRTMTNAIAWSYTLLAPDEQRLFRRIGVFAGSFSLDAMERVSGFTGIAQIPAHLCQSGASMGQAPTERDPLIDLMALVDSSLVQREGQDDARFSMLEPIRAFALERLAVEGELDGTYDALADWCLELVAAGSMAAQVPEGEWHLARLDTEHASIRRTLEWLYRRGDAGRLLSMVVALGSYWYERNHYHEGRTWTERALSTSEGAAPTVRGQAIAQLALYQAVLGESKDARDLAVDAVALLRHGEDVEALSLALIWQGVSEIQHGAYDRADQALNEALSLASTIPDASIAAAISARAMSHLGLIAHTRGDLTGAARWHGTALRTCREYGYQRGISRSLCDLADVARDQGDYVTSLAYYRESLSVLGERTDLRAVIAASEGAAWASAYWNQGERAARLLGAAAGLGEAFGVPTAMPTDHTAHERTMQAARMTLDQGTFDELFEAGRRLTPAEAIAEVMIASSPPPEVVDALATTSGLLSQREQEVLQLLSAGLRDREIADALFISVRTVEGHVARILAKLNVPSRTAAVAAGLSKRDTGSPG